MTDMSHLGNLYIRAIDQLDIKFFMAVTNCQREESALIALHKLRANCDQVSHFKRKRSRKWLIKRGINVIIPALAEGGTMQ